jgi:hypothetical protein
VSLREGETSKLGLQDRSFCPGINTRPSVVVVMALFPCCGMAWRDATVSVMMTPLTWWWVAIYPVRRELTVVFVIISCFSSGVSMGVGSCFRVLSRLAGHGAGSLDLGLRDRGPRRLDKS